MSKPIEILIIEDDIRIADIHKRFIEKIEGFTIVGSAHTGDEAKDWISALLPDLSITGRLFARHSWNRANGIHP